MTQAAHHETRLRSFRKLLHVIWTDPRADFSWGIAGWSLFGVWTMAALIFGLALPGAVLPGLLFGLVTGTPVFLPLYRHVRRNAAAETFVTERTMEWVAGGSEALAARRRRVLEDLGLAGMDGEVWARFNRRLLSIAFYLFAFPAVGFLVIAVGTESGVGKTVTTATSGMMAGWAMILRIRGVAPLPGPDDPWEP